MLSNTVESASHDYSSSYTQDPAPSCPGHLLTTSTWEVLQKLRCEKLAEGRGEPGDSIFWSGHDGALSGSAIYRVVTKAAEKAGIDSKPVSPHSFRHAHITHALQNGATLNVVMEPVGHANLQVTSDYSHTRPDKSSSDFIQD